MPDMSTGRPTKYNPEICDRLPSMFENGESVAEVCKELGISKDTFYRWEKEYPEFSDVVERLRDLHGFRHQQPHKGKYVYTTGKYNTNDYIKQRRMFDIEYKIHTNISAMVRCGVNDKNRQRTFSILPYSVGDLKSRLESLFTEGMNWGNYGEWHVDHIRPRSSFSFNSVKDKEFIECWALENLQPLWAIDNLSKGKRWAV